MIVRMSIFCLDEICHGGSRSESTRIGSCNARVGWRFVKSWSERVVRRARVGSTWLVASQLVMPTPDRADHLGQ